MSDKSNTSKTRISLKLAKTRVKAWLDFMSSLPYYKDNKSKIPRAVYIPFADIDQLKKDCEKHYGKDKIKGIRMYFGLAGEDEPIEKSFDEFRGLIVPVLEVPSVGHKDAIHESFESPDPEKTNIYDFTAPCPRYCDEESELYLKME